MDNYFRIQSENQVYRRSAEFYRQRLLQDSPRLFKDVGGNVELLSWPKKAEGFDLSVSIESTTSLSTWLRDLKDPERNYLFIIRQKYSWDNLHITRDLLLEILRINQVFIPFLDCVHAFGFRKNDDDGVWEGCHRSCNWEAGESQNLLGYELAYTYRYVINNGRTEGPQWSIRQTTVYQKMSVETGCSTWIVIQPDNSALQHFKAICLLPRNHSEHPMALHLAFLNAAQRDWKDYVGQLRLSLQELDEKACFSRVGKGHQGDYNVSFSDGQQLQKIRHKLFRSTLMLRAIIAIITDCKYHCTDIEQAKSPGRADSIYLEMDQLISFFNYYKIVLRGLTDASTGTAELIKQIRSFYFTEELARISKALETSVVALRTTAVAMHTDGSDMLQLAKQNRGDAIRLKILTHITIIYLPATLIATIFSSNLIESQPLSAVNQPSRLVISQQFWIYVIVTIVCTILTSAMPRMLESRNFRRWLRR